MKTIQKLANSKIAHKIGYGYALTISVAVIGTILGLSVGEYYKSRAIQELTFVNHKLHVIHNLQNHILILRFHPQQLLGVADDLIWFQYEKDKFQTNINGMDILLSDLKTVIQDNPQSVIDPENYHNLVQEYEITVEDYSHLIKSLWLEIDNLNTSNTKEKSRKDIIIETIQSESAVLVEIKFERILEQLLGISKLVEIQNQEANKHLIQARLLKRKIIITSMLLSIGVAILLARYTSKAIASPIEEVTHVARKVTRESNFNIQANVTTEDEIGLLAEALNQLITQVKNLLADREAEVMRQKQQQQELQKAKETADAANRAKSIFLTNMSHELRTPLNGILGYAQILKHDHTLTPQQAKGLQIINDSGNHLLTLINDILDMSKIEAGKVKLCPHELDFAKFLEGIVSLFSLQALQKGIIFSSEFSKDIPAIIIADEKRLRQILINLIGNAIKFTNQGRVTFRVTVIDQQKIKSFSKILHFEVIDTGIGIAQEEIHSIFNPFAQVTVGEEWKSGTGLGLPISRQLVEMMQGRLEVKSELNKGSTFFFKINLEVLENVKSNKSQQAITEVLNKPIENNSDNPITQELTFIVPDANEMKILHELALIGNMKKIRQQASYLREIDNQYTAFADRLQVLATGFHEKEILSLVEKYLVL